MDKSKLNWIVAMEALVDMIPRISSKPATLPATLVDVSYLPKEILNLHFSYDAEGLHLWDMSKDNSLTASLLTLGVSKKAPVVLNFS
jgi:hypothetical protein